jgi:Aspartyl/Asparaginyl beta-hydroxylase
MNVPSRVRLPISFDAAALAAEALRLPPETWVRHFNTSNYEGDWVGVALRSVGGAASQLYPDPAAGTVFSDTEILYANPLLRDALARFHCPLLAARLLALAPGSVIKEHRDYRLGWEDGEVRIHIPLVTDDRVEFVVDGQAVRMEPGEAWYLDLNKPHRVTNGSAQTRIHLVVDCVVDEWLTGLMLGATSGLAQHTG